MKKLGVVLVAAIASACPKSASPVEDAGTPTAGTASLTEAFAPDLKGQWRGVHLGMTTGEVEAALAPVPGSKFAKMPWNTWGHGVPEALSDVPFIDLERASFEVVSIPQTALFAGGLRNLDDYTNRIRAFYISGRLVALQAFSLASRASLLEAATNKFGIAPRLVTLHAGSSEIQSAIWRGLGTTVLMKDGWSPSGSPEVAILLLDDSYLNEVRRGLALEASADRDRERQRKAAVDQATEF
ncbi:MAG: hypothetical protein ACYC8T_31030 [Myxococcaceae bacterium]